MKILLVNNNAVYFNDIVEALDLPENEISIISEPPLSEEEMIIYHSNLSAIIEEVCPDLVLSVGFYPFISLFCGLTQIKYHIWILEPYSHNLFDESVTSPYNRFFFSDKTTYELFKKIGVSNVSYLPYGCPVKYITTPKPFTSDDMGTIMFWGDCYETSDNTEGPFCDDLGIKDSTRGYLEGVLACKCQLFDSNFSLSVFPEYVKSDIKNNVPYEDVHSFETYDHFVEKTYLNPVLSSTDRATNFHRFLQMDNFTNFYHINRGSLTISDDINTISDTVDYSKIREISLKSPLHVLLPSRNRSSGLSPLTWTLFGSGAFILLPQKIGDDLNSLHNILFDTANDMLSKSAYFNAHISERNDIIHSIQDEISLNHSLQSRIQMLLQ